MIKRKSRSWFNLYGNVNQLLAKKSIYIYILRKKLVQLLEFFLKKKKLVTNFLVYCQLSSRLQRKKRRKKLVLFVGGKNNFLNF